MLIGPDLTGGIARRMGVGVNINQFDFYVLRPVYIVTVLLGCPWVCNSLRRRSRSPTRSL